MAHLLEWEVLMPEQIEKGREGTAQGWGGGIHSALYQFMGTGR